jgi:hypothetical protein
MLFLSTKNGFIIMNAHFLNGEHTLIRYKDACKKCQCLTGIDGLTNS